MNGAGRRAGAVRPAALAHRRPPSGGRSSASRSATPAAPPVSNRGMASVLGGTGPVADEPATDTASVESLGPEALLALQRRAGNQAVARLVGATKPSRPRASLTPTPPRTPGPPVHRRRPPARGPRSHPPAGGFLRARHTPAPPIAITPRKTSQYRPRGPPPVRDPEARINKQRQFGKEAARRPPELKQLKQLKRRAKRRKPRRPRVPRRRARRIPKGRSKPPGGGRIRPRPIRCPAARNRGGALLAAAIVAEGQRGQASLRSAIAGLHKVIDAATARQTAAISASVASATGSVRASAAAARARINASYAAAQGALVAAAAAQRALVTAWHAGASAQTKAAYAAAANDVRTAGQTAGSKGAKLATASAARLSSAAASMGAQARAMGSRGGGSPAEVAEARSRAARELAADGAPKIENGLRDAASQTRASASEVTSTFNAEADKLVKQVRAGLAPFLAQLGTVKTGALASIGAALAAGSAALASQRAGALGVVNAVEAASVAGIHAAGAQARAGLVKAAGEAKKAATAKGNEALSKAGKQTEKLAKAAAATSITVKAARAVVPFFEGIVRAGYQSATSGVQRSGAEAAAGVTTQGQQAVAAIQGAGAQGAAGVASAGASGAAGIRATGAAVVAGLVAIGPHAIAGGNAMLKGHLAGLKRQVASIKKGLDKGVADLGRRYKEGERKALSDARDALADLSSRINTAMDKAEAKVRAQLNRSRWQKIKDAVKANLGFIAGLVVGLLIVALIIVTFGGGLAVLVIAGAIAGAVSAGVSTAITNVQEGKAWHTNIVRDMAIGAVTGAIGGAISGGVGGALASRGVGALASFGIGVGVDAVSGVGLGIISNVIKGDPWNKTIVQDLIMGAAGGVVTGGLAHYRPGGRLPGGGARGPDVPVRVDPIGSNTTPPRGTRPVVVEGPTAPLGQAPKAPLPKPEPLMLPPGKTPLLLGPGKADGGGGGALVKYDPEFARQQAAGGAIPDLAPPVKTPHGIASQEASPAAMAARAEVESGATLWRLGTTNRSAAGEAQFWSLEHPLSPDFASRYGVPSRNILNADFIESAELIPGTPFVTRSAPGVGQNAGGGIEAVVPVGGVRLRGFSYVGPKGI